MCVLRHSSTCLGDKRNKKGRKFGRVTFCGFFLQLPTRCLDLVGSVASYTFKPVTTMNDSLKLTCVTYVRRPWVDGDPFSSSTLHVRTKTSNCVMIIPHLCPISNLSLFLSFFLSRSCDLVVDMQQKKKRRPSHTQKYIIWGGHSQCRVMGLFFLAPILDSKKLENEQVFKFCLAP